MSPSIRYTLLAWLSMALVASVNSCSNSGGSSNPLTQLPGQAPPVGSVTVSIPQGAMGMGSAAYGANPLSVPLGTTVVWVNQDSMSHTATSDSGAWDSGTLAPGQQFSFRFDQGGSFPYHCTIHGSASMSGLIVVGTSEN